MLKTKIAIACQGGGSQTAFTAGALKALSDAQLRAELDLVSISGTSGGAVCAALMWYSYEKQERPAWGRLLDFWKDNTAHGLAEETLNQMIVDGMRLINRGTVPAFQLSPSSPLVQMMMSFMTLGSRKSFTEFPELLRKYIDFDEIAAWGPRAQRPVLIIGAANVMTGNLTKFSSRIEPIQLEHILASCAVPSIFPAVKIGEDAYWDGLFSDNPPIEDLTRAQSVGEENIPEEIWLIKINPTATKRVPLAPDDIVDRRNQLEGNLSLFHQLEHLELTNDRILARAFRPEYLAKFHIKAPIRIPKSFSTDPDKPYHIPCIEMSSEVQERLDYEGKLDRSAQNIDWLIEQGQASAEAFLARRGKAVAAMPSSQLGDAWR